MNQPLKIGVRIIPDNELLGLLQYYDLLPTLKRELLIDQVIADISYTYDELVSACKLFYQEKGITTEDQVQEWLLYKQLNQSQLESLATRNLRLEKFKQKKWKDYIQSYFFQRKTALDEVTFSMIHIPDLRIARELYFRIQEGEQTFVDLAREFNLGIDPATNGLIGPVELGTIKNPLIYRLLSTSQPGQLSAPIQVDQGWILVRLEKLNSAQLSDETRNRLLDELFNHWLDEQLKNQ